MTELKNTFKNHKIPLLFILLSSLFYLSFGYDLERADLPKLLLLYLALFLFAFQLIKTAGSNFRLLVIAALIFRVLFLFATPNLSQDFYRFIWDGRMILKGFNPYLHLPQSFVDSANFPVYQGSKLYNGMGELSAHNYTNYPPLNQLCFVLAALFSGKSILGSIAVMRLIIIAADIGILYFGKKLLKALKLPPKRIFWYLLNPFIIIELTGNLHFEGVMLFFMVWSLYLLHKGKWQWSAVLMGCSIATKLIPLMFLPLFLWWFFKQKSTTLTRTKKLLSFYGLVGLTVLVLFAPFFSMPFITNYSESVGLWFGNFEFNASIYYLGRELGYELTGFNEIAIISKVLSSTTLVVILSLAFFRDNSNLKTLILSMLIAIGVYLFLSTTVHPWYLATLVVLSLFTDYKFPIVWSFVVILSYCAYSNSDASENLWIVALEYALVFFVIIWEVGLKKRLPEV